MMEIRNFKELLASWTDFVAYSSKIVGKKSTHTAREEFEIDEYLKLYHSVGAYYYIIADSLSHTIVRIGGSFKSMTGYDETAFLGKSYSAVLKTHSLLEILKITKGGVKYFQYLYNTAPTLRPYVKVNYTCDFKRKNGTTYQCLAQNIPILFNEDMEPIYFLCIYTDISDIKTDKRLLHYIIDSSDAENIKKIDIKVDAKALTNTNGISAAEKKVLLLIADGLNSKQIAEKLFLSEHTVRNHRKNMLHKLDCTTSSGLIKKCILNGWL